MVSNKPQRSLLTTRSINGLTGTAMTLATAALATWAFIVDGTSAHPSTQRCYACGPLASHWFTGVSPPSCDNFTETANFTVDCGSSYDSCATIMRRDQHVFSRLCHSNPADSCSRKMIENMTEDYIECKCSKPLCNNKVSQSQIGNLLIDDVSSTMLSPKKEMTSSEEHKAISTSSEEDTTEPQTESNEATSMPTVIAKKDQKSKVAEHDTENQIIVEKTSSAATPTVKDTGLAVHSLPEPAALGQKDKNSSNQGAPIDDEEDVSEGSGSRMETDHKSNTVPPTLPPVTEHSTVTTTETPKNFAPTCHTSMSVIHVVLTTSLITLLF